MGILLGIIFKVIKKETKKTIFKNENMGKMSHYLGFCMKGFSQQSNTSLMLKIKLQTEFMSIIYFEALAPHLFLIHFSCKVTHK